MDLGVRDYAADHDAGLLVCAKRPVYFLEDFDSRRHDFNVIASGDVELDSARIVVLEGLGFKGVSVDECCNRGATTSLLSEFSCAVYSECSYGFL